MQREYHCWYSPSLGRDMELLIFGHAGARVLVFPTSMGRFFEWEDRDMIGALAEHLERGWLQLYCVDSVNDLIYFNNPCAYIPNEHEPARLEALRRLDIILAVGRDDPLRLNNEHLSGHLWAKGIWHALRVWDGWAHDWPWWRQMIRLYIGGHD